MSLYEYVAELNSNWLYIIPSLFFSIVAAPTSTKARQYIRRHTRTVPYVRVSTPVSFFLKQQYNLF